jgi:hypothetical protein
LTPGPKPLAQFLTLRRSAHSAEPRRARPRRVGLHPSRRAFGARLRMRLWDCREWLCANLGERNRSRGPANLCRGQAPFVPFSLTLVSAYATFVTESNLVLKGRWPVIPDGRGECGARERGFITSAPGLLRASACRHYDRYARCIAGLGQAGAGNARGDARGLRLQVEAGLPDRTLRPSRRKPGLEPSLWDESLTGENRSGTPAGERARKRRAAQAAFPWRAPHAACVRACTICVCLRFTSLSFFLSFFPSVAQAERSQTREQSLKPKDRSRISLRSSGLRI